ncbi:ABC transporter ATP-binding protein [Synechococcus elongatus]|uniref:ABC transporter ATP-binding protein n=1 Tax=Synechococcus elongatus TaxID=32046 RepID=UPI0030CC8C72
MQKHASYHLLWPYLRPQAKTIVQALLCTLVFTAFWPILAYLAGQMVNLLVQGQVWPLARLAGITIVGFLIHKVAQYGQDSLMAKAALQIAYNLRVNTYRHIQRLSLSYFEKAQTGDLTYRLTEDIDRIGEVVNKVFHDATPSILQLIVVLSYMIYLNWTLTLAIFVIAPIMGFLVGWFGQQMLVFSRRSQSRISDLSSLLTEVFSGIRLVRAFAAEPYEIERFSGAAERNREARYRTAWLRAIQYPVIGFLQAASILFIVVLGSWQISTGQLNGPNLGSYVAAIAMLIDPIVHLIDNFNEFKQGQASLDRIDELLSIEPAVQEDPNARMLPPITGKVEFRQVSFSYRSANGPVLRGLNLTVEAGEAVALVGASGAGKSTLVNLIPRFYDPQEGEILVDGIPIRSVTLGSLRRQIGIVPQETILFSGTIAQNIAFGQQHFDRDAVEEAARIANAHQFISQMPDGYDTWVGERGVNLSGGQRQRLAIARAVLLNPRILILDEATSALDSESETLVQEALERVMKDRTVFIIAHRLATVRNASRILVMERGQIVEAGNHDALLAEAGRYARYYAQQFRA